MKVPKYIRRKVEAANRLIDRAAELNFEVEQWMEAHGVEDAFDVAIDESVSPAYQIPDVDGFIEKVEAMTEG